MKEGTVIENTVGDATKNADNFTPPDTCIGKCNINTMQIGEKEISSCSGCFRVWEKVDASEYQQSDIDPSIVFGDQILNPG